VVFTKCDLIQGFCDFFADLKEDELIQPFGVTFAENKSTDPVQVFNSQFDDLLRRLNKKVFRRLQAEKDEGKKRWIKDFPLQLEALRPIIAEVVNGIPISEHLALFGVYFTSSAQQGIPNDYLPAVMQEKLGAVMQPATQELLPGKRSYFIKDLFKEIIFAPKMWIIEAKNKKINWQGWGLLVVIGALVLFSYQVLHYSYIKNVSALNSVNNILRDYRDSHLEQDSLHKLQFAIDRLEQVNQSWWGHVGFGATQQLDYWLRKNYYNIVATTFVPQLQKSLENEITTSGETETQRVYNALRVYLMLNDPSKLDVHYVQDWFNNYWNKKFITAPEKRAELVQKLSIILNYHIKIKADPQVITVARSMLDNNKLISASVGYQNLLAKYKGQELSFVINNESLLKINKIYTRDNFNAVLTEQIPAVVRAASGSDDWVLNNSNLPSAEQAKVIGALRSLYLNNYVKVWSEALQSVKLNGTNNIAEVSQLVAAVANGELQWLTLLKTAQINLLIVTAPAEFTQLVTTKFGELKNVDIVTIQTNLNNLVAYLAGLNSGDVKSTTFNAVVARFQEPKPNDALTLMYGLAAKQPEPIHSWLQNLADTSWQAMVEMAHLYLNEAWAKEVVPAYQKNIENNYPIFKEAQHSININDFASFFGPNGVMDKFFNTYLKSLVDTSQVYWVWKSVNGQHLNITQDVLEVFIRAALIKKMFYPDDQSLLATRFALTPLEMTPHSKMFILDLDGQKVSYEYGQKKVDHLVWPGPTPNAVTIEFFMANGSHVANTIQSDPWAWFRLLDKANLHPSGGTDRFNLTFDLNGNSIRYELIPEQTINPFIPNVINSFRCPEKI